jgi:hypothetical protein
MKRRGFSSGDAPPRPDDVSEAGAARVEPTQDECCALLRPSPDERPTTANRRQPSQDTMNRAGKA